MDIQQLADTPLVRKAAHERIAHDLPTLASKANAYRNHFSWGTRGQVVSWEDLYQAFEEYRRVVLEAQWVIAEEQAAAVTQPFGAGCSVWFMGDDGLPHLGNVIRRPHGRLLRDDCLRVFQHDQGMLVNVPVERATRLWPQEVD